MNKKYSNYVKSVINNPIFMRNGFIELPSGKFIFDKACNEDLGVIIRPLKPK